MLSTPTFNASNNNNFLSRFLLSGLLSAIINKMLLLLKNLVLPLYTFSKSTPPDLSNTSPYARIKVNKTASFIRM
jgi:hypothetical protein